MKCSGVVLVTGATGFIGSNICQALVAEGLQVRAFHRPTSPLTALAGLPVEHALGDLTQPETLAAAMKGVEIVFHTAAQLGRRDMRQAEVVTVAGTRHVLEQAAQSGVRRVIHTSSAAALGLPENSTGNPPLLIDEYHTWNCPPQSWVYGYTKYLAEMEVQRAVASGLDVVIVNPAVVLGAGDLNRISGDIIVRVAHRQVPVAAPGGLNVIHIQDVVRGHLAAVDYGRRGERYILGGENLSHRDFLRLIAQEAGVPAPKLTLSRGLLRALKTPVTLARKFLPFPISPEALNRAGYYFYFDTTKAQTELGLHHLRPASQAIAEAYTWYRQNGFC